MTPLLSITGLTVKAATARGTATILRGVDLELPHHAILGLVGESGSGKSTLGAVLMRLLPEGLTATGSIRFDGVDLLRLPAAAMQALRGNRLAMISQDPMSALNPLFTIGTHLVDVVRRRHPGLPRAEARARAAAALARVGIADPAGRLRAYPHMLSGGMRQRVVIAMALLTEPALLVADEPTTALDATVEAQIAALFAEVRRTMDGSVVFISHHLGLVAQLCDTVCVLYGGTVVESGPVAAVVGAPLHPYTQALLACEIDGSGTGPLRSIPGEVPDPVAPVPGCIFATRCPRVVPPCHASQPPLAHKAQGQRAACILVPDG